ncbi:MAG: hypothetical protein HYY90_00150 [Candidatus Omnitrophica bacterium]|nr:hypothetical protein [Candidatus Omnitrophota bacterium]MBI3082774.1 hypothetical protein [Candidatus Omnitrophota bacterium]
MRLETRRLTVGLLVVGFGLLVGQRLEAQEQAAKTKKTPPPSPQELESEAPWMQPIPVPADPELEAQLYELQDALKAIHEQIVRRKRILADAQDETAKATLFAEIDSLRTERDEIESLLHQLVNEARASERTAIDEALANVRMLEWRREQLDRREEIIRDRQE